MKEKLFDNLDELSKLDETLSSYISELEKNQFDYNAWKTIATVLFQRRMYVQSVQCYEKALEINPNYVDAWNGKGNVLSSLEKYEEAIKCYDKALEINPSYLLRGIIKAYHLKT
jgi:tetratricopeptide (TPR) repeat protein